MITCRSHRGSPREWATGRPNSRAFTDEKYIIDGSGVGGIHRHRSIGAIPQSPWLGLGLIEGLRTIASNWLGTSGRLEPQSTVKEWPLIGDRIFELWGLASTNLDGVLKTIAPHLRPMAGPILGTAGGAGAAILKFLLSLVLMGFLFVPGPRMVRGMRMFLMHVIPERSDEFLALAGATIRTISHGILGIAVLQSSLAGVGFKMAGVPAPAF